MGSNAKEKEMKAEYGVYVGIDWADRKNVYALRVNAETKVRLGSFAQSSVGIEEFVSKLKSTVDSVLLLPSPILLSFPFLLRRRSLARSRKHKRKSLRSK